jgi:hypothetical protein
VDSASAGRQRKQELTSAGIIFAIDIESLQPPSADLDANASSRNFAR